MNIRRPMVMFRSRSYKQTFGGPPGKKVLADLKRFCRAQTPTADVSSVEATFLAEGRREVWLRIMAHLNLTEQDIYDLQEDYPND